MREITPSGASMSNLQKEIIGLQYLRGIAALGVVLDHASAMASQKKYFGDVFWNGNLFGGAIGVDLFFLLSGFIIATVSLNADLTPKIQILEFFRRRIIRIVPMMWIAIISYALLRIAGRGTHYDIAPYVNAFFLLPFGDVDPKNIWTLRHEFIFYSLFAISFLGPRRLLLPIIAWIFSPVFYLILYRVPSSEILASTISIFLNPVNIEFGAGLAIGLWWTKSPGISIDFGKIDPLIYLIMYFSALIALSNIFELNSKGLREVVIASALCAPLLILGITAKCPPGPLQATGKIFGDASYAIYLFHPHIQSAILGVWSKLANHTPIWIVVLTVAVISTMGGVAIHLLLEKPLLRWVGTATKFKKSEEMRAQT
jgi:exopolysaccharide production protein ExoZ